jgi:hypothetical protein
MQNAVTTSDASGTAAQSGSPIHTLYISKRFTGGILEGLIVHEVITGPDADALLKAFPVGRKVTNPIGGSPYVIVDASFQRYVR